MEMMRHHSTDECDKSPRQKRSESKSSRDSKLSEIMEELNTRPLKPTIKRRNSTGTIYVDTTMSAQDNQATIRCVCAVIRAHMIEAETERIVPKRQFDTFKDADFELEDREDETFEEREERMKVSRIVQYFIVFH